MIAAVSDIRPQPRRRRLGNGETELPRRCIVHVWLGGDHTSTQKTLTTGHLRPQPPPSAAVAAPWPSQAVRERTAHPCSSSARGEVELLGRAQFGAAPDLERRPWWSGGPGRWCG